ncbi:MAG: FecR domain-containing protein, partial [Verrucomicrobiota bacterium]
MLSIFVLEQRAQAVDLAAAKTDDRTILLTAAGKVDVARKGVSAWQSGQTNQVLNIGDRLRTGKNSRATVRLSNLSVLRVYELTTLEIQPGGQNNRAALNLESGAAYLFNRDKPQETQFRTPTASGAIRGTEFNIVVGEDGKTVLTLIDGEVDLSNELGKINLRSGEQGVVEKNQPPRKTAVIDAINILQWALYYPGILDVDELNLSVDLQKTLAESLDNYRAGDLLNALAAYPAERAPVSETERIYKAALLLAVGNVAESEMLLRDLHEERPIALGNALSEMIAAVKQQPWPRTTPRDLATELMAGSYYEQSHSRIEQALGLARAAQEHSPRFGFAAERVAELEFSFGHTDKALTSLGASLVSAPRNAQALSLQGFLLAAKNKNTAAISSFDRAIAADGSLGNAWLGRGLMQIRRGDADAGRKDLQVAAALEPNRAVLRSYLGKAFSNADDTDRAVKELALARTLDPNDPTSWLYAALLNQQRNRVNEAVADLEKSQALNDNRSLFRSRLLLDQDRAVRGANLAQIYRDAGMTDVSVREASRAVNNDYGNYSAHLFLAESYDVLRDPKQINLRYETPFFSELLVANLLAPVGGGTLSQNISQQEYSRLFEGDRLGISSRTEYLSSGDWRQDASQFGSIGN